MDFVDKFNIGEGTLWIVAAIILSVNALRLSKPKCTMALVAGISFFFFGITDFVESTTDSFPPPWWLMLWKTVCFFGFASMYVWYLKTVGRLPKALKRLLDQRDEH